MNKTAFSFCWPASFGASPILAGFVTAHSAVVAMFYRLEARILFRSEEVPTKSPIPEAAHFLQFGISSLARFRYHTRLG